MTPAGRYFIDGKDLWTVFNIFVESGSDGFLEYPAKKDSITHDWLDSNGIDVDLTAIYFQSRQVTLNCALVLESATAEALFWDKYNAFIAQLAQPGERRLTIARFSDRDFYVFYVKCSGFRLYTPIVGTTKVACKFQLTLEESVPKVDNSSVFIVDEDGRFLIS